MFKVELSDINLILRDFGISLNSSSHAELERYNYEKKEPTSKKVRLIEKVILGDGSSLVIRFKNEDNAPFELLEKQSGFAELLKESGVSTPKLYKSGESFVKQYTLNGYDVLVMVEEFVNGEIKCVDETIAEKAGALLAKIHNISEKNEFHVNSKVLFDPFTKNELFAFTEFAELEGKIDASSQILYWEIMRKYQQYMEILYPLQIEPRYAVQGDFSDCNLYQMEDGALGVFDFNWCGDSNLYCDAVMQAMYFARLMDYPESYKENPEKKILQPFLRGYQNERPFSSRQKELYQYLYSIIDAFWLQDMLCENSIIKAAERNDCTAVQKCLEEIWRRISTLAHSML